MNTLNSYKTKQRDFILDCLMQNKDKHINVDEIMDFLNKEGNTVGKTTIYRYLNKLVSRGFVRKYFLKEGSCACFQYIENSTACHEHYHLKCLDCGKLIHLECNYLCDMNSHVLNDHDFHIDNSKTVLYGQCVNCKINNQNK